MIADERRARGRSQRPLDVLADLVADVVRREGPMLTAAAVNILSAASLWLRRPDLDAEVERVANALAAAYDAADSAS